MPTTLHENFTHCGDRRGRGAKTYGFLRFLKFPRDPLRAKAHGFLGSGDRRGRGAKTHGFLQFLRFCVVRTGLVVRAPAPGTGGGFDSSLVRGRASQDATCILKQLAQSNLRRASCTEQLAQTNLHRPVCAERLA